MTNEPATLSLRETARRKKVVISTVYIAIWNKRLDAHKDANGKYRITVAAADAWKPRRYSAKPSS